MNKKTLALIAVVVIIIILLLLKGCDFAKKPTGEEEGVIDLAQYRTPFINANIDFSCQILEDDTILQDNEISKTKLNESYTNHLLPVDDDLLMIQILDLYENDSTVIQEIRSGVKEC